MKLCDLRMEELFSPEHSLAGELLAGLQYPWEALKLIREFILRLGEGLDLSDYDHPAEDVWIHKSARVWDSAFIAGPCIIGAGTEVRHGAFIRGSALVGSDAVVGNSTELKNCILFDRVQAPHYNYVGDSILGYAAHMGAGSILSNVRGDRKNVKVHLEDTDIETGLRKFGAILGDYTEIGCGSVINPGVIIGRGTQVYPLSSVRGTVGPGLILRSDGSSMEKRA